MGLSAVTLNECSQLSGTDKPFILILKKDDNLFEALKTCATKMQLRSASIYGLGALDNATLAYYHLDKKTYQTQLFPGMYELISLQGNITTVDGEPFLHIHVALGQSDYSVIGGHLMDATVGPTAEITIIPLGYPLHRKHSEEIGLKLICPGFHP